MCKSKFIMFYSLWYTKITKSSCLVISNPHFYTFLCNILHFVEYFTGFIMIFLEFFEFQIWIPFHIFFVRRDQWCSCTPNLHPYPKTIFSSFMSRDSYIVRAPNALPSIVTVLCTHLGFYRSDISEVSTEKGFYGTHRYKSIPTSTYWYLILFSKFN
jgi:hypothetical protein